MILLRTTVLVIGCLVLNACAPTALWLHERSEDKKFEAIPRVVGLPTSTNPTNPLPPYQGPHPAVAPFQPNPANYPVRLDMTGPIDTSLQPLQYPFACQSGESNLGSPAVDNHDGVGTPVFDESGKLVGFSKDCGIPTIANYYYKPKDRNRLLPYDSSVTDMATATVNGVDVPFVVRVERGTINRFIYAIAVLADPSEPLTSTQADYWNRALIYYFRGGVGIGKRQGKVSVNSATRRMLPFLEQGYALVFSSGTQTSNHYNMRLAGRTASMVKAQFTALYGKPEFTIGLGGSGGAVQQYLAAQNHPDLLDGLIPVYSYPDMVTQTIWALDCELLEYYFDVTARKQQRWKQQTQRTAIMGLAASNELESPLRFFESWAQRMRLRATRLSPGSTECAMSWRGLIPLMNNPTYTNHKRRYRKNVSRATRWSHWHDLKHTYGVDAAGYANRTFSNEGVQYGIRALQAGVLSLQEFVHLNANIGTWKPPAQQRRERYWLLSGDPDLHRVSLWSDHNMRKTPGRPLAINQIIPGTVIKDRAPRTQAKAEAIDAVFRAGEVFIGKVDVPIIDVRHYLDDQLDMHHSFASFSARERIRSAGGNLSKHVIWVAHSNFDLLPKAVATMHSWLRGQRPSITKDACYGADGRLIAQGSEVWDGDWNGKQQGVCMQQFPAYQSPRNAAGEPINGDVFQCALESVTEAAARGSYGPTYNADWLPTLRSVFPLGVCNYQVQKNRTAFLK